MFVLVYEESFSLIDKDGDGNISNYEIRALMNSLGYSPSDEDISSVISKIDVDGKIYEEEMIILIQLLFLLGDGTVDFNEFLTVMRRRKSIGESDAELKEVFDVRY